MGKEQINSRVINAVGVVLDTHKELTQTAIAKMLGIKPSTITEILKGRMNASIDLMELLTSNFGVSATWLLVGTGEMFVSDEKQKGKTAYYSPAVSGVNENVTEYNNSENPTLLSERVSHLKKENEMLTQIIKEKERLIGVLMNQTK